MKKTGKNKQREQKHSHERDSLRLTMGDLGGERKKKNEGGGRQRKHKHSHERASLQVTMGGLEEKKRK